jgi:lipoyl(octanoyl) transferase
MSAAASAFIVRELGRVPYVDTWERMKAFVDARDAHTPDELWLLEHDPVYTLGLAGDRRHVLNPGAIPIVNTDRGGQVTYHGPGQLVAYTLLDMKRRSLGPRELVRLLEEAVIRVLAVHGLDAARRPRAPGVYIGAAKIASLGLRIRRNCSYHGLALNVAPDLAPFRGINPCGYEGLAVTSLAALGVSVSLPAVSRQLATALTGVLGADRVPAASDGRAADNDTTTPAPTAGGAEST